MNRRAILFRPAGLGHVQGPFHEVVGAGPVADVLFVAGLGFELGVAGDLGVGGLGGEGAVGGLLERGRAGHLRGAVNSHPPQQSRPFLQLKMALEPVPPTERPTSQVAACLIVDCKNQTFFAPLME